jgi:Mg-chelatase subunit ChlI
MAAVLILVTILSALATFAALKSVQRTPQGSQAKETVAESSSAKLVENPALAVQPAPSPAEQTTTSISNMPDQKPSEEVSSQQSDHASSSSANVPSSEPAISEVKPRVSRTSSSYINEERKGSRPKRRQGEAIVSTDNSNPSAEAKTPVTVTPVPNPPTTQPQSSKVTTDAPPLPVEAIKGSSTKRKVIQWP